MKPGSILLIESEGFLPNQIRLHMKVLARQLKREPSPYNHAETVVRYRGHLVSMGARANGAEITPLEDYIKAHPKHLILEPVVDLTEKEINHLEQYCEEVCFINKRPYQNLMFFAWIAKIKTWSRMNWGNKSDKRVYCYELAARAAKLVDRWDKSFDELVSIYDLLDCKHFKHE